MNTYIVETQDSLKLFIRDTIFEVIEKEIVPMIREMTQESKDAIIKDEYLNIAEACKFMGVSYPTIRKLIDEKKINYKKFGRRYFINKKELFTHNNNLKLIKRA